MSRCLCFFSIPADFDFDQNVITNFTYSQGQRGCQQLVYDSFTYVKNSVNRQRTIWKCSRKVSLACFIRFVCGDL